MAAVTVSSRPPFLVLSSCVYYCFLMHAAIHVPRVGSLSFNLSFSQPQSPGLSQLINCTGDAMLAQDTLVLTRTTGTAAEISRNRDSRRASASAISIGVCSRAGMAA
ncbi:unnamed protein product [Miscanthus lutarioriparius]|uniref:Uncharacterized protein n=1 Tax=Miscanthus lutarioriparius TaxID=422564 RepID=A0A811RFC6_9POAL|nr:unnamed protein product [Miscanthus lutarioriparius]